MKKIFLICLTAGFISTGFAQSSVEDVPENKIKPAYELAQPAKKAEVQKQTPKNTVQSPVIITDKNSSLYEENKKEVAKAKPDVSGSVADMPVNKATPKIIDNTGSVMDTPAAKTAAKKADVSGSVVDMPAAKATDKKLAIDGSLLEVAPVKPTAKPIEPKVDNSKMETPAAKPSAPQKVDNSGSVAPDTKKTEVKPVAPKSTEPSSLNGN